MVKENRLEYNRIVFIIPQWLDCSDPAAEYLINFGSNVRSRNVFA